MAELEAVKVLLGRFPNLAWEPVPKEESLSSTLESLGLEINGADTEETQEEEVAYSDEQKAVLEKYLGLWHTHHDPTDRILHPQNVEPPSTGAPSTPTSEEPPRLAATISAVTKNKEVLKGGYLLVPNADSTRWLRRFVELRRPYLHIHSVPDGEEIGIISLRNSRVDHRPEIAKLLQRDGPPPSRNGSASTGIWGGRTGAQQSKEEETVFAVYGMDNTWLFKTRSERDKVEWIFKIDMAYFGSGQSGGNSGDASGDD